MEAQVFSTRQGGRNFNSFIPQDNALMADIHKVLDKHNALKRFGVTLLQEDFQISEDEILIESTDMAARTQTIKPYKLAEVQNVDAIETSWRLDTGHAVMNCKCIVGGPENGHQHYSRG
ncbi:MAG: hypothetical protein JWQ09_3151 [Segetibacter sp.]|nr:hypothetical protein [Segetibacter sp.]